MTCLYVGGPFRRGRRSLAARAECSAVRRHSETRRAPPSGPGTPPGSRVCTAPNALCNRLDHL